MLFLRVLRLRFYIRFGVCTVSLVNQKGDYKVSKESEIIVGEVHVLADDKGGISVNAPANILVALAILEGAKMVLVQKQQAAIAAAERRAQAIVPANAAMLEKLTAGVKQ